MNVKNRFENKVAIVTGAASGIGLAITRQLIKEGAKVVGADINEDGLRKLKEEFGQSFVGSVTDVVKEEGHRRLVTKALELFGKLDFAFNVAGASKGGVITELPEENWDFTMDLVLKGVFLGMKHQARQMKSQHYGSIINVSSLNAHVPMYGASNYASAKAAVEMLTKNGALELARFNIRVNAILPGLVETPLTDMFMLDEEIRDAFMDRIPMNRAALPDEIAAPALFLASEEASYVNGASLVVDGAWSTSGYPDLSKFKR